MKVLFISRRIYPDVKGGGQISALYIAKAVKKQGIDVYVCTFTNTKKPIKEEIEGISIIRLPIKKLRLFPRVSNLDYMYFQMMKLSSQVIETYNPDLVHFLNFESILLTSIYIERKYRLPQVATVNCPLFGCFTGPAIDYKGNVCTKCHILKRYLCATAKWGNMKGSLFYVYSHWYMTLLKISYKYIDKFLTISRAMSPILVNMGVNESKITCVSNPLGKKLKISKKKLLTLKNKYKNKKIILCAARLGENKGVQYLVKTLVNLPKHYILLVAGEGGYKTRLLEMIKNLNVCDRVVLLGKIPHNAMGTYYELADIFAHFPRVYEALGRAMIESMSLGTPVIAYPIGGIIDVIEHKKNGFLLKSYNPKLIARIIKKIIEDKNLYYKLSDNSKKTVRKKFSNKSVGKNYMKQYNLLLKNDRQD